MTPFLPKQIGVVNNQLMGIDRIITPAPANTGLQIKDDKGDGQHMVANVNETPPRFCVPTPHDEDMSTQQLEDVADTTVDRPVRKKTPSARYPSETYDLSSTRLRIRRSISLRRSHVENAEQSLVNELLDVKVT